MVTTQNELNRCPCCGAIRTDFEWHLDERRIVTPHGYVVLNGIIQTAIFDFLYRNRHREGVTYDRIADSVYASSPDGGTRMGIASNMMYLRKLIAPIGLGVTRGNGYGSGCRLILTTPEKVKSLTKTSRPATRFRPYTPRTGAQPQPSGSRLWRGKPIPLPNVARTDVDAPQAEISASAAPRIDHHMPRIETLPKPT